MKKIITALIILALSAPAAFAYSYFEQAVSDGVLVGDPNGVLHEDERATRAEFAAMTVRFLGLSGGVNIFSDVSDSDWFSADVSAAAANGMLMGYEDGKMRPHDNITCEDAVAALGRYYEAVSVGNGPESVSDYAKKYYAFALENDLFTGWRMSNPHHKITKKEIAELLYKYAEFDSRRIGFTGGTPKISDKGVFNNITLEIETNEPCTVYYGISGTGTASVKPEDVLCEVAEGNTPVKVSFTAPLGTDVDILLRAANSGGVSRTVTVKNARSFPFTYGSGTSVDPYIIYSSEQLKGISRYPDKVYILGNNITVDGEYTPIENFSGILDGNGYTVDGLHIDGNSENVGLVGILNGGTVKNLTVDADITANKNAGIIAGINENGVIESCSVTGKVTAKTANGGGVCGINRGTVSDTLSAVTEVKSGTYAGGICGQNEGSVSACLSAVSEITADMYAGGISGVNNGGNIENCVAANITVFSSMTKNNGRITLNRDGGITSHNYAYDRTDTNSAGEIESEFSQNGIDTEWSELIEIEFYKKIDRKWENWISADNGFRLPYPKRCAVPHLAVGESIFMPKQITDAAGLMDIGKNPSRHYILGGNIRLNLPWKTICGLTGFSGSLDGGGYTVYGLELKGESGFFSNISGGTVRNLNFDGVKAVLNDNGAVIAACNYGFIENCSVRGTVSSDKAGAVGIIAGQNNGQIISSSSECTITQRYDNVITGGICSDNSGIVIGCSFDGTMDIAAKSASVGGICGYTADGYVLESFANANITVCNGDAYVGGICGIASGAQIYKCGSAGKIKTNGATVYSGGICGFGEACAVYNCFSAAEQKILSSAAYAGGICGFANGTNVQNTYACADVITYDVSGGICGFAENSFIMQNVALCPKIDGNNAAAITAGVEGSELADNYSCDRIKINSESVKESVKNGKHRSLTALKEPGFYFKPIANGGALGWDGVSYGGDVWYALPKSGYPFPLLSNVPGQKGYSAPVFSD